MIAIKHWNTIHSDGKPLYLSQVCNAVARVLENCGTNEVTLEMSLKVANSTNFCLLVGNKQLI